MEIAAGVDILYIDRLKRALGRDDKAFLDSVYSQAEQEAAGQKPVPLIYYATRFAGKEAVIKALSRCEGELRFNEIEILTEEGGAPFVRLSGDVKRAAEEQSLTGISISLSSDTDYAIAFATANFGK